MFNSINYGEREALLSNNGALRHKEGCGISVSGTRGMALELSRRFETTSYQFWKKGFCVFSPHPKDFNSLSQTFGNWKPDRKESSQPGN